jgi:hypothetical protein
LLRDPGKTAINRQQPNSKAENEGIAQRMKVGGGKMKDTKKTQLSRDLLSSSALLNDTLQDLISIMAYLFELLEISHLDIVPAAIPARCALDDVASHFPRAARYACSGRPSLRHFRVADRVGALGFAVFAVLVATVLW